MKIFLPFKKDGNTYLDEIEKFSKSQFTYGNLNEYDIKYDIVNIHWPEALYGWHEPTEKDLEELAITIKKWKQHSLLVYTKHDFQRNKGSTPNFDRLFEIVETNTDIFIHLGEFSQNHYKYKYPHARHEVIYHPLYKNSFEVIDKQKARAELQIDQNAIVLIAPGNIRKFEERKMVLSAFKRIPEKNKVLICTNMHAEIRFDFRGRIKLKRIFDVKKWMVDRFKTKYRSSKYIFTYKNINSGELALKVSAADIVFIPRTHILNSGIVFLGLTFNKPVVGPDTGNISEQLKELNLPVFDPKSASSVNNAICKAIKNSEFSFSYSSEDLKKYQPQNVAANLDTLMQNLSKG